jgi:hypothetical protein
MRQNQQRFGRWCLFLKLCIDAIAGRGYYDTVMKNNTSLQEVAAQYNCTLLRACTEILAAAGEEKRRLPAVIRKQRIPAELVVKAKAYRARKINQIAAA